MKTLSNVLVKDKKYKKDIWYLNNKTEEHIIYNLSLYITPD